MVSSIKLSVLSKCKCHCFLSSSSRMVNIFVLLRFNIWWENARRNIYEEAKFSETSGNVKTSVSECHMIFFFINIDRNIEKHLWKEASSVTSESWKAIFWRLCNVATDFPRKVELADKNISCCCHIFIYIYVKVIHHYHL